MRAIKLTNSDILVFVDDEDFEMLNVVLWYAKKSNHTIYVARSQCIGNKIVTIRMHRLIMKCPIELVVHHKNGNAFNNQKTNLEVCTQRFNLAQKGNHDCKSSKHKN